MKRAIAFAVTLTFVAGCSGGGLNGGSLLPGTSQSARVPGAAGVTDDGRQRILDVHVTMRIPRRHRNERIAVHPATISSLTQSVGFVVNGGAAQIFNATTSSANCKIATSGKVCTFSVKAPPGTDSFVVTTYSGLSGGGSALDRGTASIKIAAGKANAPTIHLGPVVSTTADTGPGSLRYAIGSANPGDTILFTIPKTSTITVASPLTLSTSVSIAGPGVSALVRRHSDRRHPGLFSNVAVSGLTISGGGAQQIFVINAGVTATISGLILHDGLATVTNRPGGAVYSEGAVTLTGDAFTDNGSQVDSPFVRVRGHVARAHGKHHRGDAKRGEGLHPHCSTLYYYGGAVYNHGSMNVTNSIFDANVLASSYGCTYTYGGAIYTDQYGSLTSSGNSYSNNSAYYGGAVYVNASYGQASFTNDTFTGNFTCSTTTGCALSGCGTPTTTCTTYPYGEGGAIFDGAGPGITVTNSKFTSNYAGGAFASSIGDGGALYLDTGSPSITGSTFTGNLAGGGTANCSAGDGGAIYESAANTLELDNDTFTSNKASGDNSSYGGAVYNNSNPDNGSGNTFTSNQAVGTGGACNVNAYASGGAIYADYGLTMSGSTFKSNSASSNEDSWGGAVYSDEASILTSDTFTSNSVTGTGLHGAGYAEAYGGAVYTDSTIRITGSTFTSNSATAQSTIGEDAYGGALYLNDTATTNGNTFASNSASIPSGTGSTYVYGGAVYASSTFLSNGDKYTSNTGSAKSGVYGGGLYVNSSFGVTNATFTSNKVTATGGESYGGGIAIDSSGTISNSTITSNSASSTGYADAYDQGGGGIYDNGGATLNGLKVASNTATGGSGGGIYVRYATETVNNSTISGNSASVTGTYGGGGGVYNYDGMSVTNTTISGNTAAVNGAYSGGGGIYVDDTTDMAGSTISGNKVTGTGSISGGGGVYDYFYALDATNTTISNNSSALDGGGILFYDNPGTALANVTIYQNSATGNGGGIYNDTGSTAPTLANTIVAGSTGGKDVYNLGTLTSMGYNILQTAPTGGGTFTAGTGDKTINPALLALSNNGGPTFTNADQSTSPGKAYAPWSSASGGTCGTVTGMSLDQRGFTRGTGNKCDVGAYEYSGTPGPTKIRPHAVRPDPRKPRPKRPAKRIPAHERNAGS